MKKIIAFFILGALALGGCAGQKPANGSLTDSATKTMTDDFDVSLYIPSKAQNVKTVTLDLNGDGVVERAVYFEEDDLQNVSLLMKVDGTYEEQRAYFFSHTGNPPQYLKEMYAADPENDGREILLFNSVSPNLQNPTSSVYNYVEFKDGDFKFVQPDEGFTPPKI